MKLYMNPSYTNEVGASAGNFAGAPMGSGAQGAPMGSGMQGAPMGSGAQGAPMGTGAFGSSSSQAGGDIILGAPKKKSRKWIGFLALGVVVIIAVVAAILMLLSNTKTISEQGAELKELIDYIENGPSDAIENTDESTETNEELDAEIADTIYAIRVKDYKLSVIEEYYKRLNEKVEKIFGEKDDEQTEEYKLALKILENAINYRAIGEKMVDAAKMGVENARIYFEGNFDCTNVTGNLAMICQAEARYYEAVAGEYFLYAENGCYRNDFYDLECLNNIDENLESSIELPNEFLVRMTSTSTLRALSREIKTLDQKMLEEQNNA